MSDIQKALDAIAPYERFKSRGRIVGDDVKLHEFGSTYTPEVVAELEKQLAGLQALLKGKDEALQKVVSWHDATEKHHVCCNYHREYEGKTFCNCGYTNCRVALAQTSGTDALDKMLAAERVKGEWVIDALRGQLKNCVNLLHRMKRHGHASDVLTADKAIDSANRVLYETLIQYHAPKENPEPTTQKNA